MSHRTIPTGSLLLALCLAATTARAQQQLTLPEALDRLAAQAAALEHSLPSLTCMESAVSQERKKEKILRSVDFTSSLRARRNPDESITESREYRTLRGQPFTSGGFVMPMSVTGGFSRAMRYFSADQHSCYQYTLKGDRIDFTTAPPPLPQSCSTRGISGFALIDDDANILHLERTVTNAWAIAYNQVPHAVIDFTGLTLNGNSYRMTKHLIADQPNHGSVDYFEATYSDCRLFGATVTIGPAIETTDTADPPK